VADGTIFEKRGIVSAVMVTSAFTKTADSMARRHGYPEYRYALLPHPIGNLKPEQIRERAQAVLPQVLAILGLPEEATPR
jgi:hypothetical protein